MKAVCMNEVEVAMAFCSICGPTIPGTSEAMVGRSLERMFPAIPTPQDQVTLEVRGLCAPGGTFRDVNFAVKRGEVFGIAGLVAFPLFQMSCYLVGQMNIERELRADAFGACLTSPATMREALLALTDEPPSSAKEAFDTFHPSMKERTAILGTLEQEPLKSRTCAALLSGKEPIVIDGHVIQ